MTNLYPKYLLGIFSLLFSISAFSQAPGCPNVEITADRTELTCEEPCTLLTADYLLTGETTSYRVDPIFYAPPFPFTGGAGSTNITADDRWSETIDLGFEFCFFGESYTKALISSNGAITFSINGEVPNGRYSPSTPAGYPLSGTVPGNNGSYTGIGSDPRAVLGIFGVLQDTNPATSFSGWSINYEIIGAEPCRMLVFNMYRLGQFSCNTNVGEQTYQMVLYETTNVIDVYVQDRTPCNNWHNGNGVIGIQNHNGTVGYTPPGRNTGNWSAHNEAWRFTPSGEPNVEVNWYDGAYNLVGSGPTLLVCEPGTYTAVADYTSCTGDIASDEDSVTVTRDLDFEVDLGEDISVCGGEDVILDATPTPPTAATYEWFLDGVLIPGETNSTLTVTSPDPGVAFVGDYSVKVTIGTCEIVDNVEVEFLPQPVIENPPLDIEACTVVPDPGLVDLTQNDAVVLGTQDPTFVITYHNSQSDAETGLNDNNPANAYPIVGDSETIWVRIENSTGDCYAFDSFEITLETYELDLGEDISVCGGEEVILDGNPGGTATYEWFLDGVLLPGETNSTLIVTPPLPGDGFNGVYSVEATAGNCIITDSISIEFLPQPVIENEPLDMYICRDVPGPGVFDLTENDDLVLGTQDPAFVITYHNSQNDAETGLNDIDPADAYTITGNSEIIWVRIENASGECYAIDSFEIAFASAVAYAPVSPHLICDQNGDGEEIVDLETTFNTAVLNGQNPVNYIVTYHNSQNDADLGINSLGQPVTVDVSPTTFYVRVESRFASTCYDTTQFDIELEDPPLVNFTPSPLIVCDTDNDGFAFFNLHDADLDISLGDSDLIITYHPTLLDAQNNLNELTDPYENDDPYNDVVFVRVESPNTSCYVTIRLDLIVRNSPILVEPTPLTACGDDFAIFNLPTKESEMLGTMNPAHYDFYYYELEADAIAAGDSALTTPDYSGAIGNPAAYQNITNPQTIYVLAVGNDQNTSPHNGGEGCYDIVPLELIVYTYPEPIQPLPYELCDDLESGSDTDQISTFDLTTRHAEITGGDPSLSITWFETHADEQADLPIANPRAYQNREIPPAPLNPQTIIARVTNENGCSTTITLTLVVNPLPVPADPTPLEMCDDNNDGFAEFDLTLKDVEITNGETNVTIRYYTTRERAEIGALDNQITGLYTNDDPYFDSVWARVEKTRTGCYAIVELELVVNPLPDAPISELEDLLACDEGAASAEFDLTQNEALVYGSQSPNDFSISYHTSEDDANIGLNPILDAESYTSSGQTIWVRLENNDTQCARISSFDLIVGAMPVIIDPEDMALCDDHESGSDTDQISIFDLTLNNNTITDGDTSLEVFYYETLADQQNNTPIANPSAYANPVDGSGEGITPYTLFVSVYNETGCYSTTTLNLVVMPVPRVVEPSPLILCDDDNDGFGDFMLTDKDDEISNGNPAIVISYHETLLDAENGTFPLASPFQNIVRYSQTIYARATFDAPPNESGCFTIVPLELIVSPKPVVPLEIPDLVECDPTGSGFAVFDLTEQAPFIYGDQDPADFLLTYHLTQGDADLGINRIATPSSYTNITNPQEIYVRLGFIDGEGCYATGHFTLIVADAITINTPTPLELCNELGDDNDMRTTFDLTVKNAEITGGVPGMGVSYFLTEQDAIDNVDRIDPETAFENTENPQRVYVRVIDGDSDCVAYTSLLLRVLPNPDPVTPAPLELCDVTVVVGPGADDGVEIFDLTERAAEILNGENWRLSYFESYENAVDELDEIQNPDAYENTSNPQTIYVRVTNDTSGCFSIVELELIVHAVPLDTADISPYMICELDTDGVAEFDLITKIPEILGGQSPTDYEVSFYLDPVDAVNGENAIVEPERHINRDVNGNTENPQTIYTGILVPGAECYIGGVQSFELIVQEGVIATAPAAPFTICDNLAPSDGIAEFDLEDFSNQAVIDFRNEILSGQDPLETSLTFYETMENAMLGVDPIVFPYTNIINPQVIYARVTNEMNIYDPKCFEVVEAILKVEELPMINFEEDYRLCIDAEGNPVTEESGAQSPPVIDTYLDPTLYTFEWLHDGVILPGEHGPSVVALAGGDYTVTVTEIATGCITSGVATVWVSAPPTTFEVEVTSMAFSDNHAIEVHAEGIGTYVFQLDDGPFQSSGTFENVEPGSHTVTIRDENGCGSITIPVGVVDYPPFFTPNEDGYNDTWNVIGMDVADPMAKIYIFDRFGKLLKQLSPMGPGWDGTYNGNPMPSSDYWFRIEYTEDGVGKEIKGHFTLKR